MRRKTVAISGYFLILHVGHLYLIREASKYGKLVVIVNNDQQQILKYNKIIVPLEQRIRVMEGLKHVNDVVASVDKDRTVCETLKWLKPDIFVNGGDRNNREVPEEDVCERYWIKMIDGVGEKLQSSTNLLNKL